MRLKIIPLCTLLAATFLACGSKARPVLSSNASACSGCHGSADNPAPPASLAGGTSTSLVEVGAHQAHLQDGAVRRAIACSECHVVPATVDQLGHMGLPPAPVQFATATSDLAASGASPSWNHQTATCSGVYCHGATLGGGSNTAPVWTRVGQGQADCGTCHGLPPGDSHPAVTGGVTACPTCHPGTVRSDGTIDVVGGLHINGQVDVGGAGCSACHGDPTRTPVAGADPSVQAAPPVTATGRSAGAHLAHVNKSGEIITQAQFAECHSGAVPTSLASHPSGSITVAFGGRVTTGGASPIYSPLTLTCSSTYCHGNFSGGASAAPTWTGSSMTCTSCHGDPPSTGRHGVNSHQSAGCSACHPGYTSSTVNAATHVNGTKDVGNKITSWNPTTLQCVGCHGSDTW